MNRAKKLLGDEAASRYCVYVSLYGDETGEGEKGAWNLLFAAADGSKKHVYVNMQGEIDVKDWNGPIDLNKNDGRRIDLADVRQRLETLFAQEGIKAEFESQVDKLSVKYNVRTFQVHSRREEGGFSEEVQAMPGPDSDGIWLQVQVVTKLDHQNYGYRDGPYWQWVRGTYFTTTPRKYLSIDFRYGFKLKYEIAQQIWEIFGERAPRG